MPNENVAPAQVTDTPANQPAGVGAGTFANDGMSGGGSSINGIGVGKSAPKITPDDNELFEVQIDGATEKLTRKEVLEHARLGKAAFKRMQEAADVRKKADSSLARFKDPEAFIEALLESGLSEEQVRTKFEDWYEKRVIKPSEMTPEQRRIAELEARIAKTEREEANRAKQAEENKRTTLETQYAEKFQKQIIDALENSGLPRDPKTVGRMAYYMNENIRVDAGQTMPELVERVRSDYRNELRQLTKGFEPKQFVEFLGEDSAKILATHYANELRKRRHPQPPGGTEFAAEEPAGPKKKIPEDRRFTPAFSKSWIPVVD